MQINNTHMVKRHGKVVTGWVMRNIRYWMLFFNETSILISYNRRYYRIEYIKHYLKYFRLKTSGWSIKKSVYYAPRIWIGRTQLEDSL